MVDSATSCETQYDLQVALSERAAIDLGENFDEDLVVQVQQGPGCFYNEYLYNDRDFKACVGYAAAQAGATSSDGITDLFCTEEAISDVTGLENFTNLQYVDLSQASVSCVHS